MGEWLSWVGGENPVPGKMVDVMHADGEKFKDVLSENVGWNHNYGMGNVVKYRVIGEEKATMRNFETGATRDSDEGKLHYKGFISTIALKQFAEYMETHRVQSDGSLRDPDNWKKGIPLDAYEDSFTRHFFEWLGLLENNEREAAMEIAPALFFNLQGWMHEMGKKNV